MAPKATKGAMCPFPPSKSTTASKKQGRVGGAPIDPSQLQSFLNTFKAESVEASELDDDAPLDAIRSAEDISSELADIESHDRESMGGEDAQLSQGGQFGYDK